MKSIFAVAGLAAVGAAVATPSAVAQDSSKPWNVGAELRGFYDDNYATLPSNPLPGAPSKRSSFGFDLRPEVGYRINLDQTSINLRYQYGIRYYEDRRINSADHSHDASASLDHTFSERFKLSLKDNFVISQEPGVLDPTAVATPLRSEGNNWRNTAGISSDFAINDNFTLASGYTHSIYDYKQTGVGSRSALLDRIEHLANVELLWRATETIRGIFGYRFGMTDMTSKDAIAGLTLPDERDARSHTGIVGWDHQLSGELGYNVRGGITYSEYPNAPVGKKDNTISPLFDVFGKWKFAERSYAGLGLKHERGPTDIGGALDAQKTVVYGNLNCGLTEKIDLGITPIYQLTTHNQGAANNLSDNYFTINAHLNYKINDNWNAFAGYDFTRLDSDLDNTGVPRSYSRNIAYVGVKFIY